jgi:hypothetical protein
MRRVGAVWLLAVGVPACGSEVISSPASHRTDDGALAGTVGVFVFQQQDEQGSYFESALTASFRGGEDDACITIRDGACTRRDCRWQHRSAETEDALHAGRITAASGDRKLVLEPGAGGTYRAEFGSGALWENGKGVVIEAAGGSIPYFRAELPGPSVVTIEEPPPPSLDAVLLIRRGSPFVFVWGGSETGDVLAVLSSQSGSSYDTVTCSFPAGSGEGIVSADILSDFNVEGSSMRLSMGVGHSQLVDADGFLVDVVTYSSATTTSERDASYSVRFRD